jgi:hypothetical protein
MEEKKVQWTKKYRGKKVVILPDGSEMDSKILSEKYNLSYCTAVSRINDYIIDGNYEDLIRDNRTKKESKKVKYNYKLTETHYEDGNIRMYVDPFWKILAKI